MPPFGAANFMVTEARKAALVKKYPTEMVYVIPYDSLKRIQDKFTPEKDGDWVKRIQYRWWDKAGKFIFRYDAEENPVFQQIIPYILVCNKEKNRFFVTKRIAGEERLKGSLALGCGGHINPCDAESEKIIFNAALRELNEELNAPDTITKEDFDVIGTVRSITSTTNDHLGVVMTIAIDEDQVSVKEIDNLEGVWMDLSELVANYEKFESWARFIIDYFYTENKKS